MGNPKPKIENLTPFKKGNTASVGHGRPKGSKNFATILKDIMSAEKGTLNGKEVDGHVLLMATLYQKALKDKDLPAIREIMDRMEGKTVQKTEIEANITNAQEGRSKIKSWLDDKYPKGDTKAS